MTNGWRVYRATPRSPTAVPRQPLAALRQARPAYTRSHRLVACISGALRAWRRGMISPRHLPRRLTLSERQAMIRFACDSDRLEALIPTPLIFTYADLVRDRGHLHALRARFPGSTLKLIDRGLGDPSGTAGAVEAIDVEPGANGIVEAAAKIKAYVTEGREYVTGYADRNDMPKLVAATQAIGVTEMEWWKWYATLDGTMRVQPDPDAMVQFANAQMVGLHVDMSVIWHAGYHPEAR